MFREVRRNDRRLLEYEAEEILKKENLESCPRWAKTAIHMGDL